MRGPHSFTYKYDAGPLPLEELKAGKFIVGNCRRAIQDYLYSVFNLYLEPEKVLLPKGYLHTGVFITQDKKFDLSLYKPRDIIYAQRIKTQNTEVINLHTAVFIDKDSVYHATSISGRTCVWNIEKFQKYYQVIAVKRVL